MEPVTSTESTPMVSIYFLIDFYNREMLMLIPHGPEVGNCTRILIAKGLTSTMPAGPIDATRLDVNYAAHVKVCDVSARDAQTKVLEFTRQIGGKEGFCNHFLDCLEADGIGIGDSRLEIRRAQVDAIA